MNNPFSTLTIQKKILCILAIIVLIASIIGFSITISYFSKQINIIESIDTPQTTVYIFTDNTVILEWNKIPGAIVYRVLRSVNYGPYEVISVNTSTKLYFNDKTAVDENTSYRYRVIALNKSTDTYIKSEPSNIVYICRSLVAPTNVAVSVVDNNITITWKSNPAALSYRIYRTDNYLNCHVVGVVGKDTTSFTDTTTVSGTKHGYMIKAVSKNENGSTLSEYSEIVYIKLP